MWKDQESEHIWRTPTNQTTHKNGTGQEIWIDHGSGNKIQRCSASSN